MMSHLFRLLAIPRIAFKRLWSQKAMSLITILGLGLAVALFMTVPLYSEGVNFRILEERLRTQTENRDRPPFAYLFSYIGAWHGTLEWEALIEADGYLMGQGSFELGMPRTSGIRHFETTLFQLFAEDAAVSDYEDATQQLELLKFAMTTDFHDHIELVEGRLPVRDGNSLQVGQPIEVMIAQELADVTGFQPGEIYNGFQALADGSAVVVPLEIVGVWRPIDGDDPYWIYSQSAYEKLMYITEEALVKQLAPATQDEINLAAWYFVMDGSEIGPSQTGRVIAALGGVERQLQNILPDATTFLDPTEALGLYRQDAGQLNRVLSAFNLPTIGLVMTFIGLLGTLWADRLRNELAVLRSRGITFSQLMGTVLVEALIIGGIAYLLGIVLSLQFSSWMGQVRSFLDFSAESGVRIQLSNTALLIGLGAIGVALVAQLIPTISAAQQTIISYKLIQGRVGARPWWQRSYLDLLLLGISGYGIYLVQQQDAALALGGEGAADLFQNPLFFLLPALLIYAVTLLTLRLLPGLMDLISRLLQLTNSISLLQASRYLARSPRTYTTPFILLVLTVSFAIYTASLAQTLDFHIYDQLFYKAGADINLFTPPKVEDDFLGMRTSDDPNDFLVLPMSEYEALSGVQAATRVGVYGVQARIGSDTVSGQFYGIDRETFADVGYWRWDFSPYRLGSLLNGLGEWPDGLIIPRSLMRQTGVRVGETILIEVELPDQVIEYKGQVVGTFDQFPTWYPQEEGVLIVGNLDYLYGLVGNVYPYRVWLDTDEILDRDELRSELNQIGLDGSSWQEPHSAIQAGLQRPERQGLFGLLSVGFIAATLLTTLGLALYTLFSYQRRVVELGVLRAIGLSTPRMVRLIAWELALLIVMGVGLGSVLGLAVSQLFIPSLQVGVTSLEQIPQMVVEISWGAISQIYILFAVLFVLSFSVLAVILMRMRLFMAIKLGETV